MLARRRFDLAVSSDSHHWAAARDGNLPVGGPSPEVDYPGAHLLLSKVIWLVKKLENDSRLTPNWGFTFVSAIAAARDGTGNYQSNAQENDKTTSRQGGNTHEWRHFEIDGKRWVISQSKMEPRKGKIKEPLNANSDCDEYSSWRKEKSRGTLC